MDEALTLVADAVRSARGLRLDSTVSVTLQRAVGDNQLTFVVQVPPAGQVEAAAAAAPRTFARASAPPRAIAMGGESSEMRPRVEPALGPRMNSEIDVLAISGVGERRETLGGTAESDEVKTLMAEIERLKRKALSRGVNLTSQHEDVPAEDVARLRAVFSMADSTGSGYINASELQALHALLGEPLTDEEASDAFRRIDVNQSGDISFDDFLSWFTLAHSRSGMLSKKGLAYNQRFKKLFARIEGLFDLKNLTVSSQGVIGTLEFRLNFHYNDNGVLKRVSPWHDIPLYSQDGNVHFICEIPKWTRKKFEIATGEEFNPIKQDTKNGKLRDYNYGDMLFNYGAFPQTWEDPKHKTDVGEKELHKGDNDPIDGVEIGTMQLRSGSVTRVKVLGVLAMIDDGETDWKVLCISVDDPYASRINNCDDLNQIFPNMIPTVREWFRVYKTADGKPENKFGFGEKAMDREFALKCVEETHEFWKTLTLSGQKTV
mmetsp:Transcript_37198/g.86038  ORF Transcript_37198/g.86038 Transcript_37198/m.86038 type:complete len:489 (+) Transcript_37198:55-1521(+)